MRRKALMSTFSNWKIRRLHQDSNMEVNLSTIKKSFKIHNNNNSLKDTYFAVSHTNCWLKKLWTSFGTYHLDVILEELKVVIFFLQVNYYQKYVLNWLQLLPLIYDLSSSAPLEFWGMMTGCIAEGNDIIFFHRIPTA